MGNTTKTSDSWLASRLIFDASLVVGMLGFAAALWGVPGLKQLGFAAFVGVACATASFVLLYACNRVVRRFTKRDDLAHEAQQNHPHNEEAFQPQRIDGMEYGAHSDTEELLSYSSINVGDRTVISSVKPKRRPAFPKKWSVELIQTLDWQVFDNLCVAYWKMKGYEVVNRSEGSISGTRFYLAAAQNKSLRLGLIKTRSTHSSPVSVVEMQKLLKRQQVNKLPLGVLMYAGKLSNVVVSFCEQKNIRLIGAANIYQGLSALPEQQQTKLLQKLIRPDYMIPTCPHCKIKLVKRMRKDTRRLFWGCISYPECRFKMDYIAPY